MDEEHFELQDYDKVVLECASDKDCMREYLLRRGATQEQIEKILNLQEEDDAQTGNR